jgi:DNA-binding Lrp family transcriptional regulator
MTQKITSTFDFPTDDKYWRDGFAQDVNRPCAWLLSARDLLEHLHTTGDALRAAWMEFHSNGRACRSAPPRGLHRVYLFLSAVVVENLLKAIIVHRSNWPDSRIAQKMPDELKSHFLLDLATAGGVTLAPEDPDLLERLTEFGIWQGRYPAPTELRHVKPKKLRNGSVNLVGHMYGSDIRDVERFINNLIASLVGVQGIAQLVPFPARLSEDFEEYSVSPNIRPW